MAIKRISFSDIDLKKLDDVIDVRSPSEYEVDHIPGAINLPVLSDKEREMVGTIYKQNSKFEAKKLGAALISENISNHLKENIREKKTRLASFNLLLARWTAILCLCNYT